MQLGFDSRWSAQDKFDGVKDKDSGGFIAYLSPGVVFNLAEDLQLNVNAQIAVIDDLKGDHAEDQIINVGLTYDIQ